MADASLYHQPSIIVGLAMADVFANLFVSPTLLRVVRVFRVGRVLRLVKSAKGIRTLLFSLAVSMPALINIGLLLFLVMFIYAIFGMSFFMSVKHNAGIDDMFNFETFFQSMIILFQMSTSAGWDSVLLGLFISPPDCDPNPTDPKPNGECGSYMMGVVYIVTYLVVTFLVIINMYIAVILENFSQATEDMQQGLTQDDFDMYYEVWEKFDEKATEYIFLDQLSEFISSLEEPLGIQLPNYFKIVEMDITICEDDRIHCVDILDALTKNFLGTGNDAGDVGAIKDAPARSNYNPISSTRKRQREILCAKIIQRRWRNFVKRKKAEHAIESGGSVRSNYPVMQLEGRTIIDMDDEPSRPPLIHDVPPIMEEPPTPDIPEEDEHASSSGSDDDDDVGTSNIPPPSPRVIVDSRTVELYPDSESIA